MICFDRLGAPTRLLGTTISPALCLHPFLASSQIMESRYELERTWKSSGCQAEVKAKLDSLTRALKGALGKRGGWVGCC